MGPTERRRLSRFMSLVLRHRPGALRILED